MATIGRPGYVTSEFVQPGATVIDVGINRLASLEDAPPNLAGSERIRDAISAKGRALVGDVDFDDVSRVAGWIAPVPGGVGPLTVAMLLANTVLAARLGRDREEKARKGEPPAEFSPGTGSTSILEHKSFGVNRPTPD